MLGPTIRVRLVTIKLLSAFLLSSHIDKFVCPFVCLFACPSKRDMKGLGTSLYIRSWVWARCTNINIIIIIINTSTIIGVATATFPLIFQLLFPLMLLMLLLPLDRSFSNEWVKARLTSGHHKIDPWRRGNYDQFSNLHFYWHTKRIDFVHVVAFLIFSAYSFSACRNFLYLCWNSIYLFVWSLDRHSSHICVFVVSA